MIMPVYYSPPLIICSIAVAILASYVALNLAHSVTHAKGRARAAWLACGAIAMGIGIWSMHFVGMLAFTMPDMEMAYDVPLMVLSVVIAVAGSAIGLFVVSREVVSRRSLLVAGLAMAAAIAGMHFLGMYSMRMSARIEWNYYLVTVSVIIALAASFAALNIAVRLRHQPERHRALFLASLLMGIAIAGMHYTGMLAATFIHEPTLTIDSSDLLVTSGLSLATISTSLLILGLALVTSVGERAFQLRRRQNRESEERFRVLVQAVKDYGIFVLDTKGRITTWNRGAEKITGYHADEIVGRHVSTLYPGSAAMSEADEELRTAERFGHFEGEAVRRRKDGTMFWANIILDPLFDADGRISGFSKVIRDVTQLREASAELERRVQERTVKLQEREAQLREITNAVHNPLAQFDREERLLFANESFSEWFGDMSTPARGRTFRELLGEERYHLDKPYIDRVLTGESVTYELETQNAILSMTYVPEIGSDGTIRGFIASATDVSNYKRIEAEMKQAKEEAVAANRTKSAFLANMSHEIRTPLGAIIGFSELMADDDLSNNEKRNTLEVIKRNGKLLSTIINDILDLSKVEAGKLEIEQMDVVLSDLLNEMAAFLKLEAAGKGIQLTVAAEGVLPDRVRTDPTRLRQILLNIVGNAIKFTEKGEVDVRVKLDPQDSSRIAFVVRDTGTGIAPEHAERLFSPFTQADPTTTRKFGGTGLGLVLSRKLAQALGGNVSLVETEPGKGSTFLITIEHGQGQEVQFGTISSNTSTRPTLEIARAPGARELERMKVLIVDDSPDNLELIKRILTIAGASVDTAESGREGVDKALAGDYSLVLMDLQMPGMDGFEATRELRSRGYKRPILALTAHAMKEERKRCLASGFDEHITKPIDRHALVRQLAEYSA